MLRRSIAARTLWIGSLCLVAWACSSTPDTPNPFRGETAARDQTITIFVENLDFNDATLHVIADGSRERLGTVSGKQEERFTVGWNFVRDLSIHINMLAGDEFTTPRLAVNPGERVRLVIQRPIHRSYLIR